MTDVETLVRIVEEASGNVVPDRDHARLQAIAEGRAHAVGERDLKGYLRLLERDRDGDEWRTLLSLITVNESYLFRAPQQFEALTRIVLPNLVERRSDTRCLRLWSAGCAHGEEAATLAVVLSEFAPLAGWQWSILATDVDETALTRARRARYGPRAVSKVPSRLLEKYFVARGEHSVLKPGLRERIEFRSLNLVREPLELQPSSFDVIFLRNVLIYFRPSSLERVAAAVAEIMTDDGYLFLGTSESLWQVHPELTAVEMGGCFCYRRVGGKGEPHPSGPGTPPRTTVAVPTPAAGRKKTIRHAERPHERRPSDPVGKLDLVRSRTSARQAIVRSLAARDSDGTREIIHEASRRYPEDAVVRALEGLAHDLAGETEVALKSYRAALYLDPSLFQVRLLLARCMERLGWVERARKEYVAVLGVLSASDVNALPGSEELGLASAAQAREQCRRKI